MGLSVYLAARYSRIDELNGYRRWLEENGHRVTSRWLDGGHEFVRDTEGLSAQSKDAERRRFALEDWADMRYAEVVVSFTEPPRSKASRGGRHVEFGGALALGKPCVVIGHRENVFHHYPGVEFYPTWDAFVAAWFPGASAS